MPANSDKEEVRRSKRKHRESIDSKPNDTAETAIRLTRGRAAQLHDTNSARHSTTNQQGGVKPVGATRDILPREIRIIGKSWNAVRTCIKCSTELAHARTLFNIISCYNQCRHICSHFSHYIFCCIAIVRQTDASLRDPDPHETSLPFYCMLHVFSLWGKSVW